MQTRVRDIEDVQIASWRQHVNENILIRVSTVGLVYVEDEAEEVKMLRSVPDVYVSIRRMADGIFLHDGDVFLAEADYSVFHEMAKDEKETKGNMTKDVSDCKRSADVSVSTIHASNCCKETV